jgi:hypothetical protein
MWPGSPRWLPRAEIRASLRAPHLSSKTSARFLRRNDSVTSLRPRQCVLPWVAGGSLHLPEEQGTYARGIPRSGPRGECSATMELSTEAGARGNRPRMCRIARRRCGGSRTARRRPVVTTDGRLWSDLIRMRALTHGRLRARSRLRAWHGRHPSGRGGTGLDGVCSGDTLMPCTA